MFLDFYNRYSMTCSSQLYDPSVESDFVERNLQHSVGWRNLSSEKAVVRLTSGDYAACGFEVELRRKHEPFIYQVNIVTAKLGRIHPYLNSNFHPKGVLSLLLVCDSVLDQLHH